jgi:HD-GYP domain-containing protein (c-di-GMP phosphodiesterase class II)
VYTTAPTFLPIPALEALLLALSLHDAPTGRHCAAVGRLSAAIARAMALNPAQAALAEATGRLHDLGKLAVPALLLHNRDQLKERETALLSRHPQEGERLLSMLSPLGSGIPALCAGVRSHHERWDGSGYPDRLAGHGIPLAARIAAVPDALSAMTERRSYQAALGLPEAVARVRHGAGRHFDPAVVEALLLLPEAAVAELLAG